MRKLVLMLLITVTSVVKGQVIWEENFDDLGDNQQSDAGATAWTTTQPVGNSPYKVFQTQTYPGVGRVFIANDTGNEGIWTSEVIDISSYSEVALEAFLGVYWANTTDYVRAYYQLDGGPEVMFGEMMGLPNFQTQSAASAIVSGSTLRIIVRALDTNTGSYYGYPRMLGFDNIKVSKITYIYSRQSGNWNDTNSWSTIGYGGTSCGCTPNSDTHAFVGNGNTINMNVGGQSAGVTVEGSGHIQYTGNNSLNIIRGGVLEVNSAGDILKNGNNGASVTFATYSYNVRVDGTLNVGSITVDGAHFALSGSGNVNLSGSLTFNNLNGHSISNGITGGLTIGSELLFNSNSANFSMVNSGKMTVTNRIRFENTQVAIINSGTLTTGSNGILVSNSDDDGNSITNSGTLTFGTMNLNNADFTINNSGTLNQTGSFTNVDASNTVFNNLTNGTWNYSGSATTTKMNLAAANNNFYFSRSGNQTIFTPSNGSYYNLFVSGTGTKTATSTITVRDNLSISGANLDMTNNGYGLNIGGDWTVSTSSDLFIQRNGTVTFNGTGTQTIRTANGTETFNNLTIDKSSGALVLDAPSTNIAVAGTLALNNGQLNLNGRSISITNGSPSAITRTNGYIRSESTIYPYSPISWSVGNATGDFTFPFGKSDSEYIPFNFSITGAGGGATTVSVATYGTGADNNPYPNGVSSLEGEEGVNLSSEVVDRFWQIDVTGSPTATVTFTATSSEVGSLTNMKAQRYNGADGHWDSPLPGQASSSNSVTVPNVSTFSPWTLVDGNSTLPVELTAFNASLENQDVIINWTTASELNNDYFTLEKTQDFKTFYEVKVVKGHGTTQNENNYKVIDNSPLAGVSYYRLTQTDFDGASETFKAVRIENNSVFDSFNVYPNPNNGQGINLEITGMSKGESIPVSIINMTGVVVYSTEITFNEGVQSTKTIDFTEALAPGVYLIKAGNDQLQKLVVRN
ncbi:T9SS type A sorting domain-containing protein [Fulvivirga ligni]|uniref:T9SS type A sorting domain-containing protein n=1 Tax=Fulvivirga ligni TaxID=2904246 RepID=UPI001F326CA1|nr:T9SS type A sorting domain-containing protein [Fulvivirga ligni]UII21150.1 T9SS type A sorting domain-containing protein [Fulvivirga ligni]